MIWMFPVKKDYISDQVDAFPLQVVTHRSAGIMQMKVGLGKTVRASIPINLRIQLEENPDAIYQIKEIYSCEGKVLATVKYGEEFLYDLPTNSAVVLALEPAPKVSKV